MGPARARGHVGDPPSIYTRRCIVRAQRPLQGNSIESMVLDIWTGVPPACFCELLARIALRLVPRSMRNSSPGLGLGFNPLQASRGPSVVAAPDESLPNLNAIIAYVTSYRGLRPARDPICTRRSRCRVGGAWSHCLRCHRSQGQHVVSPYHLPTASSQAALLRNVGQRC